MNRRLTNGACTIALAAATIGPGVGAIGSASPDSAGSSRSSTAQPIRTLLHSVPTLVHDALDLGSINPLRTLHVAIPLAIPSQAALDDFVTSQYTPGSPNYHRF